MMRLILERNCMRKDEQGRVCPETLGEYYDLFEALGGDNCGSCVFLKEKIDLSPKGIQEKVIADDSQMMMLLCSMISVKHEDGK